MKLDVVVRCRNEMPFTHHTLEALAAQDVETRVFFFDCASTDGSRKAAIDAGAKVIDVTPTSYRPGHVLNLGMRQTDGDVVVFVNADAIPRRHDALRRLVAPLHERADVAASYGRQHARPDATAHTQLDHRRAFGEEALRVARGQFFSMAASAVRRDAWRMNPFDERLRYSEDVDWTRRMALIGWRVVYAPSAHFEHSHDYDLRGQFRRRHGEGAAETAIHTLGSASWWQDGLRPFAGALWRDARAGHLSPSSVVLRASQAAGFFAGRHAASARPH